MPLVFEDGDGNIHESLHAVFGELPLFGQLYLNMQAQNIALTDLDLREMEGSLLLEYMEIERTPFMSAMRVSAWSQMWVFAFYELLRTWRQRVREVRDYTVKLRESTSAELAKTELEKRFQRNTKLPNLTAAFDRRAFEAAEKAPEEVIGRIERALEIVEPVFRKLESVRMTLAKHEIPKAQGIPAASPGYGRIDMSDGSIYWMIDYKDGTSDIVSRRSLADGFFGLLPVLRIEDRISESGV